MDDSKPLVALKNLSFQFILVFLLFAAGIGIAGYRYFHYAKEHLKRESQKDLSVIADLKIDEITQWRRERLGDANLVFHNPFIAPYIQQWLKHGSPVLRQEILTFMQALAYQDQYESIVLLDTKGDIRLAIPDSKEMLGPDVKRLVSEAIRSKEIVFSDLYRSKIAHAIRLSLVVPFLVTEKNETVPVGALLLRVDPYRFLYPLVQSWPTQSASAETLLIRREGHEVVFLNELRHKKGTALKLRFKVTDKKLPAAMALRGSTGTVEGLDYRGVPVIAALRAIPGSTWFLVSKIDKEEIYLPLTERSWFLALLVTLLLTVTGLGLLFVWHRKGLELTRKERDKAQQYLDIAGVMLLVIGPDRKVIMINKKGCEILGYKEEETVGVDWFEKFVPEKYRQEVEEGFVNLMSGQVRQIEYFENPVLTRSGDERLIAWHNTVVRDETGDIIGTLSSGEDITERKQVEETIRREREFSASVINSLPGIFYLLDEQGKFLLWNRNFERVSEYTASEISNMTALDFFTDNDRQIISERIQRVFVDGHADAEASFTSKSGRKTPYFFTGMLYKIHDKPHLIGMGIDISEMRAAQEAIRKTMAELERSNKELEQFAYIASHDLQEPLRMVSSYMQLLSRRYKGRLDADADEFIHYAVDGAGRMQTMINDLLAYSRVGTKGKPFVRADCDDILKGALAGLKLQIEESGALITSDPLPVVMADPSQLSQVFQNLISNAMKFRGEKNPEIFVRAERKEDEWVFAVIDNGIGFEQKYEGKIFDIFKRLHTASKYPGSGIGLTICRKIVERHGGRIWAESEPGKGSAFYFTLPVRHEA